MFEIKSIYFYHKIKQKYKKKAIKPNRVHDRGCGMIEVDLICRCLNIFKTSCHLEVFLRVKSCFYQSFRLF